MNSPRETAHLRREAILALLELLKSQQEEIFRLQAGIVALGLTIREINPLLAERFLGEWHQQAEKPTLSSAGPLAKALDSLIAELRSEGMDVN